MDRVDKYEYIIKYVQIEYIFVQVWREFYHKRNESKRKGYDSEIWLK